MKLFDFFSGRRTSPQSTVRSRARQGISLLLVLALGITLARSDVMFGELPRMGQQDIRQQTQQSTAGLRYLGFMNAQGFTAQDPGLTYYLEQSLLPLLPAFSEEESTRELLVFGVNHRSFNAFALPGGLIGVHDGLLNQLTETKEVQAILAHEMGHLALGHHQRLADSRRQSAGLIIASLLLTPLAIQMDPNIAVGMLYGAQGLAIQQQLAFSRNMEEEADRVAVTAMRAGNIPLTGFIGAYESMAANQRTQTGSTDSPYPGTHPNVRDRLADLRNRIDQESVPDKLSPDIPLCWIQLDRNLNVRSTETRCEDYRTLRNSTSEERYQGWADLMQDYPANPYLIYRATEWLDSQSGNKHRDELVDVLQHQASLIPDSWLTALAMLKLSPEQPTQQHAHWRSVLFQLAPANDLTAWNTLRNAYPEEADRGRAFRAQAQTSWITGDRERAVSQLRRAIELSHASSERSQWEQTLRAWERTLQR